VSSKLSNWYHRNQGVSPMSSPARPSSVLVMTRCARVLMKWTFRASPPSFDSRSASRYSRMSPVVPSWNTLSSEMNRAGCRFLSMNSESDSASDRVSWVSDADTSSRSVAEVSAWTPYPTSPTATSTIPVASANFSRYDRRTRSGTTRPNTPEASLIYITPCSVR